MKIKIYLVLVVVFTALLVYLNVSPEPEVSKSTLPSTVVRQKIVPGEPIPKAYEPKFKPKAIPADVLAGSKANDFYYYLFLSPNKKTLFYKYELKSTAPDLSEDFHNKITRYLGKVLIDGNYKDYSTTQSGSEIYERNIFKDDIWVAGKVLNPDNKKEEKEMVDKVHYRSAVTQFVDECMRSMCIINNKTKEYVKIDKRDINDAMTTLKDYKRW